MKRNDRMENGRAAVIIPFWDDGKEYRMRYLNDTLDSIFEQTDPNIEIYLIDDCSQPKSTKEKLDQLSVRHKNLYVIYATKNTGPGASRNIGIREAYKNDCPFISFLDSDDMFHKDRIRDVRQAFMEDERLDIVYSNFIAIDENNESVPFEHLVEGIKRIHNDIKNAPLEGYDVWKEIVEARDNLTIPSALSVRTDLAYKIPFPEYARFHEDTHTWLRYSASGAKIKYLDNIPTKYRVPQSNAGSESRERAGGRQHFNRLRGEIIMDGLNTALDYAIDRKIIKEMEKDYYRVRFLLNVSSIISNEDTPVIVSELLDKAKKISNEMFEKYKSIYGF